jgi:3-oxoacyl-[acyl-carrier protein] reductase
MDLGIRGKVALVAGASRGLGMAVARGLAMEGAKVAICARDGRALEETAAAIAGETGAEVLPCRADVSDPVQAKGFVQEAASRFGAIHILVNNAGGPPSATFLELSEEQWEAAFRLNFMSAACLTREAVPHMRKVGWGRVINMTSVAVKQPLEGLILSNAVRAAVIGFAKTLADELAPDKITVNNVCPGYILTDRVRELASTVAARKGLRQEEVFRQWEASIPLRRLGSPEEFADLVVFLASERAGYITGATVQIDGGFYRGLM